MMMRVVLHKECLEMGGGRLYPHMEVGTLLERNAYERLWSMKFSKEIIAKHGIKDHKKGVILVPEWLLWDAKYEV